MSECCLGWFKCWLLGWGEFGEGRGKAEDLRFFIQSPYLLRTLSFSLPSFLLSPSLPSNETVDLFMIFLQFKSSWAF